MIKKLDMILSSSLLLHLQLTLSMRPSGPYSRRVGVFERFAMLRVRCGGLD